MHTAREEDPSNRRLTCCKPRYRGVRGIPKELLPRVKDAGTKRRHKTLDLGYICLMLASDSSHSLIGRFSPINRHFLNLFVTTWSQQIITASLTCFLCFYVSYISFPLFLFFSRVFHSQFVALSNNPVASDCNSIYVFIFPLGRSLSLLVYPC